MLNELRKAIYDACRSTGDEAYDYWKTDAVFPYFIINEAQDMETQLKLNNQNIYYFDIHYFDKSKGKTAALTKLTAVKNELKALDGVNASFQIRAFADKEPDTIHGVLVISIKYYT